MKKNKSYAVFGLGRYGKAVARELVNRGYSSIEAGRQLGIDHVTVLYGIHQLDTMKDAAYERELDIQHLLTYVIENIEIEP